MKHFITLLSALVFMTVSVYGEDVKKNKKGKNQAVAVAPFVWGYPGEDVPVELVSPSDEKAMVPVAPFLWGSPEDLPQIVEDTKQKNNLVPVAPFILGSSDMEITLDLDTSVASHTSN